MIIKQITMLDDIWKEHNHFYDDMVKFCIDRIDELFDILKAWIR